MKKNIHNVGGFVAFSGESPKVINLITLTTEHRFAKHVMNGFH